MSTYSKYSIYYNVCKRIVPEEPVLDEQSIKSAQKSATAALERLLESEFPALLVPVVGDALAEAAEGEAFGNAPLGIFALVHSFPLRFLPTVFWQPTHVVVGGIHKARNEKGG